MAKCSIADCDRVVDCRGLCAMHLTRLRRHGDPFVKKRPRPQPGATLDELRARFLTRIAVEGECWRWMPGPGHRRYGSFHLGKHFPGRRIRPAHQASFLLHHGLIPDGLHVLHTCDNHRCVNPAHLYLGTHQQNMQDRKNRNRGFRGTGASNPSAKLSEADALEIQRLRREGMTYPEIGKRYGVSKNATRRICVGLNWKHLGGSSQPPGAGQ